MKDRICYTIFRTRWGWFGLCGNGQGLLRTCLPAKSKGKIRHTLLSGLDAPYELPSCFKPVRDDIIAYFEGDYVDFSKISVRLNDLTEFQQKVLTVLRNVRYGQTITYADLAKMTGKPTAARAVGGVMSKNPLPLIIPCHRVIRSDGSPGGFSAQGGIQTKKRMLQIEKYSV